MRIELHLGSLVLYSLRVLALDQVVSRERKTRLDDGGFSGDGSFGALLHSNDVAGSDSLNHLEELDCVLVRVAELRIGGLYAILVVHN